MEERGNKEGVVRTQKIGGIWHGLVDGTDIDERGLIEEVARRKATELWVARQAAIRKLS